MIPGVSRFEGGSWVRVGFLLTYTAFAYGCVVVGAAVIRIRHSRGLGGNSARRLAALFAVAAVGALGLPAIEFPDETLNGFRGLDALSVAITMLLAIVVVAAGASQAYANLGAPAAACLAGVLGGNVLIQRFTTRGTDVAFGLWWAAGLALACLAASLVRVRGEREARR